MHSVSIVGCGYLGLALARALAGSQPSRSAASTARRRACDNIAAAGAESELLDLGYKPAARRFSSGDLLYYLVPPAPDGARDRRLERFLVNSRDRASA